jgi:hypothetical protein
LFVLSACGSGGPTATADCAWLASDNCWKMTVDDAASCLPPTGAQGTLNAAGTSCTYATGEIVTFEHALVLPIPRDYPWSFTLSKNGQPCLHFDSTTAAMNLDVGGAKVRVSSFGLTGLQFSCPDGTVYANSDAFGLLMCGADAGVSFGGLPGNSWSSSSAGNVSVSLIGTSMGSTPLFDCMR